MFNYEQVHLNSKHRLDKTYLDFTFRFQGNWSFWKYNY